MKHYLLFILLSIAIPALSQKNTVKKKSSAVTTKTVKTNSPDTVIHLSTANKAALAFHNKIRADKGIAPLQWSAQLSKYAQSWADHLAATGCNLVHTNNAQKEIHYGQNIYWQSNYIEDAPLQACISWYTELKDYTYSEVGKDGGKAGHYTQMMWKKTTQVGIGMAKCAGGGVIIVADYFPAGNMEGEKPY